MQAHVLVLSDTSDTASRGLLLMDSEMNDRTEEEFAQREEEGKTRRGKIQVAPQLRNGNRHPPRTHTHTHMYHASHELYRRIYCYYLIAYTLASIR